MRASASKAALLDGCQWWARDEVEWTETRGRSAIYGDQFHGYMAPIVDKAIPLVTIPPSTKWLRDRLDHAHRWVTDNRVPTWRAEVAYAYDPATGASRILGYNIGREYEKHGKLPHEIAGSADVAWLEGETVQVRDWKTGRCITDAVWPQLEWLALFAARASNAWRAVVGPLHVTDHGVDDSMLRTLDEIALSLVADNIRANVAAIADAWPVDGPHCDASWCPARPACDLYAVRQKRSA